MKRMIFHRLAEVPPCQILLSEEIPAGARIFIPISYHQLQAVILTYSHLSEVIQYPARLFFDLDDWDSEHSDNLIFKLQQRFAYVDIYRNDQNLRNIHIIVPEITFGSLEDMREWIIGFTEGDKSLDLQVYRHNAMLRIPGALKQGRTDRYLPGDPSHQFDFLVSIGSWTGQQPL